MTTITDTRSTFVISGAELDSTYDVLMHGDWWEVCEVGAGRVTVEPVSPLWSAGERVELSTAGKAYIARMAH